MGFSYEQLAFHLAESATYRTFCRFGFDRKPPKKATLQKNVKRVKPETWEAINRMLVRQAEALGVEDVAFHQRCRLEIEDMVKSTWVYRQLRAFRAGIEGVISFLKRGFGLGRCVWRGFQSFQAYVQASVLACNLLTVARHALAAAKTA